MGAGNITRCRKQNRVKARTRTNSDKPGAAADNSRRRPCAASSGRTSRNPAHHRPADPKSGPPQRHSAATLIDTRAGWVLPSPARPGFPPLRQLAASMPMISIAQTVPAERITG